MSLVTTDIPNLIGGVSQQPASMRLINQCEAQENAVSSPVEGLIKRHPTEHIASLIDNPPSDLFIHHVNRDSTEQYFIVCDGGNDVNTIKVFDLAGTEKTINHDPEGAAPETGYAYMTTATPSSSLKAVTIADTTFFVNTEKTVGMDPGLSTYSRNLTSRPSEALIVVQRAPSNFSKCELNIIINAENMDLYTTNSGSNRDFGYGNTVGGGLDSNETRNRISNTLNNANVGTSGAADYRDFTCTIGGDCILVKCLDEADAPGTFNISVEDGQGGAVLKVLKDEVENFSDLPNSAPNNMVFKVVGDPESDVDDYWVRFRTDDQETSFGKGRWIETTDGGMKNVFDYTTLPHVLVRQADGTFKFTQADGSYDGSIAAPFGEMKFAPRTVGDLVTNPNPTFVGNKISGIAFFENRLVFLSGENVILSEVGEYFNFFRTTTAQILDSGVIDLAVGGTEVSNLKHAIPFSSRLILFSDTNQFSLQSDQGLSPLSTSITPQTGFEITAKPTPIVSGSNLFFAFPRGSFNGVKQFYKVNEVDIQFNAVEASAQVPKYIKGNIQKMAATTHENLLMVITDEDDTSMYCFNYYETDNQRLVASWSKFTLGGNIYSIQFIDTALYILVKRESKLYLEKMRMETGLTDVGLDYMTSLDRRVDTNGGSYSAATNKTTWTSLGYTPSASSQICDNTGLQLQITDRAFGTISAQGDHSSKTVYIGEPYTMRYEISQAIPKTGNWRGTQKMNPSTAQNRHQLRYMTVIFSDTSTFDVRVTPEYQSANEYTFTGRQLGDGSATVNTVPSVDGDFRVPVFAQSDRVKIELLNSTPLPSNFQALSFEANQTSRAMRLR